MMVKFLVDDGKVYSGWGIMDKVNVMMDQFHIYIYVEWWMKLMMSDG